MNAEDFDRLFDGAFAEWVQDPAQSLLFPFFPPPVVERLRASSMAPSSLFFAELKRLEGDPKAEVLFSQGLFLLLDDEEGFDWPADDLGRCLALAVFREHIRHLLAKPDPDFGTGDEADWRGKRLT
jgi:hypothetical protein